MMYCMQQYFRLLVYPHMVKENTSRMAHMHNQRGGGHNPCYTPTKIDMVTGDSGCMEMAVGSSLHDVLYATVF